MSEPPSELDAVGRVAEAFLARYRRGERPSVTEYTQRYPGLAEQIRDLFPALVVMEELGSVEGPRAGAFAGAVPGRGPVPEQLGDYRILREVGRGGMGVVYEAVQESLGRHVALKVLPAHALLPPTHLERFHREARAAARLHHTNIVPVHGVGEHAGTHYYAMQFIQGQGLDEVLKEVIRLRRPKAPPPAPDAGPGADRSRSLARGLLSGQFAGPGDSGWGPAPATGESKPREPSAAGPAADSASGTELTSQPEAQYFRSVARMGVQVAAGLAYAHQQGILHRDIKPSNLLLDARGTVWITDFGLAKAEGSDELTHTGDIVGTIRYMAPERLRGRSDPRGDVYGLGVTLYELLTLRPAFGDSSRARLIERVTHEDPPRPRAVDRSVPRDLETIVLKAIAKEPGRRYQTAADLAEDLGRFLAGEPVRARRVGAWERGAKWVRRRPAGAALLAVSAAAALCLLVGVLVHNAQLGEALRDARDNLQKAQRAEEQARLAEREKTRQLAIGLVKEAQARRTSGLAGRRFESLKALKQAAEHFRALGQLNDERTLQLRNEAIACLALADLKRGKDGARDPGWSAPLAFDPTLQSYVVRSTAGDYPGKPDIPPGELSIRRVADDQEVGRLPGFGVPVVSTRFSPDGRYLAARYVESPQFHCYVWDLGRRQAILKVVQEYDTTESFCPDRPLVALARPDHGIRIYELPSGATWKDLPPGPSGPPVTGVYFHPDGRRLAVVRGSTVQLRDLGDGKELAAFNHPSDVGALAWRDDGKVFAASCFWDHNVYLWDLANPAQPLRVLNGHLEEVDLLGFSHGGDLLLSASLDSTSRLWDPMTGQQLLWVPGRLSCRFGPDDQVVDSGWQLATGRECRTFHAPKYLCWVAISPGGRLLASAGERGVQLWDLAATREGDKLLATLPAGWSAQAHFDPKGESLITDGTEGMQRWPITPDPETGGLRVGPPHSLGLSARAPLRSRGNYADAAISPDGRTVAHLQEGLGLLFDPVDPRRKVVLESPGLRYAAFSPDGRWLATGSWGGPGVKVWDVRTGKLARDLDTGGLRGECAWPAFSPDGKWLVTGTSAECRFWEVGGPWRRRHGLSRENAGSIWGWTVFSPDGKILAVLQSRTEVRLVDPATGRPFASLPTAGTPYCFSPDGSQLVTYAGREGSFQVWDLRQIRAGLAEMGLDWGLPPYPPPAAAGVRPLRVKVVPPEPLRPSKVLDAEAHLERGLLQVRLRNYGSAMADFSRAGELDPQRPPWHAAVRAFSQVIERNPQDARAYHERAEAHEHLGQWDQAIADHSEALRLSPHTLSILVWRGRAYLRTGQKDRAAEDFRKAGALGPEELNHLARKLATSPDPSQRELSLAVELARQAVGKAPGDALSWNTLGIAHYRAREWGAAVRALEGAEKRAPGTYLGLNAFLLAMCRQQLGDRAQAREHYGLAVRWCDRHLGELPEQRQQELRAFRAEAEALLNVPTAGP